MWGLKGALGKVMALEIQLALPSLLGQPVKLPLHLLLVVLIQLVLILCALIQLPLVLPLRD